MNPITIKGIRFYVDSVPGGGYELRTSARTEERRSIAMEFAKYASIRVLDDGSDGTKIFRAYLDNEMVRRLDSCVTCFNRISH